MQSVIQMRNPEEADGGVCALNSRCTSKRMCNRALKMGVFIVCFNTSVLKRARHTFRITIHTSPFPCFVVVIRSATKGHAEAFLQPGMKRYSILVSPSECSGG